MTTRYWRAGLVAAAVAAAGFSSAAAAARTRSPRAPRAAPAIAAAPAPVPNRCRASSEERSSITAISPDGDVALSSGKVARLVDIRFAGDGHSGQSTVKDLAGSAAALLVYGAADRWGRVPAALRVGAEPADGPAADLAGRLVSAGVAVVDAGERDGLCDPGLLALEAEARARKVGSWAISPPLAAEDGAALAAQAGRFVVVEGRVVGVGERRERTYLNFGRDWSRDFSVVVPKRVWAAVKGRGIDAERLRGRRVRVRGVLGGGRAGPAGGAVGCRHARAGRGGGQAALTGRGSSNARAGGGGRRAGAAAWLLALALPGCGTSGTVAPAANVLPPRAPRLAALESRPSPDDARLMAAFGGEYRASPMRARLAAVANRLAPRTARPEEPYAVVILDSPAVNAFSLPSGHIYLTRGLLALANDEAEIAAVIAHEMAHVTQRHAALRGEFEARTALLARVATDVLDKPSPGPAAPHATLAGFSRAQELEADAIGIATLAAAGYDPFASARFLVALEREAALAHRPGGDAPAEADMFATHPGTPDRIVLAQEAARRIARGSSGTGAPQRDRPGYLDSLDGLAFGDDPQDGQVRGRHFAHARLGVAFDAPEGFVLENGPAAVLGAAADRRRRLLFDAVDATEGQSLADLLTSSWAESLTAGSLTSEEGNGRRVVRAASAGAEWRFRLAAVRLEGGTFRLVLGERTDAIDSRLDTDFDAALASLRTLRPGEAQAMRSRRVAIVTARHGDSPEALAARMAGDAPLERFLVLNGLERGAALRPGERYKLVVD